MISLLDNARASVRRWRLVRWDVSGNERFCGHAISLTYFGHDFGFRTILQKLFAPGHTVTRTGRGWLGAPGFPMTPTNKASDIVAIELDYAQWQARDTGAGFFLPIWMRTEILVADAYQQMKKSSSVKDDLRRMRKNKIVCEVSHNTAELREFYDNIYLPYILARYGDLALPDGWDVMVSTANGGELILAKSAAGELLGGILMGRNSKRMYARAVGQISNDRATMNTGVGSALYLASFERAKLYGYDRVGFGLTGPFLNDGLLRFKKKWGLRLLNECVQGIWLQFNNATAAVESFLINNPFIYRDAGKIYGIVFTSDPELTDDQSLHTLKSRYYLPGMESLQICRITGTGKAQIPGMAANNYMSETGRNLYGVTR
jgi:hypothetical protein